MANMIVTGGCGFVGSNLVDRLIDEGHNVIVIDHKEKWINPSATYHHIDIASNEAFDIIREAKPSVVFHLAAQIKVTVSVEDPIEDARVNIIGTLNILEALKDQPGKVIFFSTGGALYGDGAPIPTDESFEPAPKSPYGLSKLAAERYFEFYSEQYNIPYIILRPANIYGPRQDSEGEGAVIEIFVSKLLDGETAYIQGTGEQTRDFIYVGDVVDAAIAAIDTEQQGMVNIGTANEISINELFKVVKDAIGSDQKEEFTDAREADVMRSTISNGRAKEWLGWEPKVSIKEGIEKTIEWRKTQ